MKKNEIISQLFKQIQEGVKNFYDSAKWKEFLRFQAHFHNYSFNNTLLIMLQNPAARKVAGFKTWKEVGRQVKKGEKAIKILCPLFRKKNVEDEKTGEVKKVQILYGFRYVNVFDVSQTEGEPLPSLVDELTENGEGYKELYETVKATIQIPVKEIEIEGGAKGYYSLVDKYIAVKKDESDLQKLKTLVHELAHSKVHTTKEKVREDEVNLNDIECEAESIAFIVCSYLGIDTSHYSFGYLAGWNFEGNENVDRFIKLATRIQKTAKEIITSIEEEKEKQTKQLQTA